MALNTYGHIIEEMVGRDRASAADAIAAARDESVPSRYPQAPERV